MAIDRGPWNALVDDDGSNLTGSIWNKAAIKTVILDPTDAAIVAPTYGTFTPIDRSGAGLVFGTANGNYAKNGRLVFIWVHVSYPVTSNGSPAQIGGFPFPVGPDAGAVHCYGVPRMWYLPGAENMALAKDVPTGNGIANSQLSGSTLIFSATYLTT